MTVALIPIHLKHLRSISRNDRNNETKSSESEKPKVNFQIALWFETAVTHVSHMLQITIILLIHIHTHTQAYSSKNTLLALKWCQPQHSGWLFGFRVLKNRKIKSNRKYSVVFFLDRKVRKLMLFGHKWGKNGYLYNCHRTKIRLHILNYQNV